MFWLRNKKKNLDYTLLSGDLGFFLNQNVCLLAASAYAGMSATVQGVIGGLYFGFGKFIWVAVQFNHL